MNRRSSTKLGLQNFDEIRFSNNIGIFWSKVFWPPNSPYLNPLDFCVWSVSERNTKKTRQPKIASVRTAIEAAFADMDHAALQRAYDIFIHRLNAVIQAREEYIE